MRANSLYGPWTSREILTLTCLIKFKGEAKVLDMPRAMQVTMNCIRKVAGMFPASDFPINPGDTLMRLGLDDARVEVLKKRIAGDSQFGLPSLVPKRKIDVSLMTFDESSTVSDVFTAVWGNAVLA